MISMCETVHVIIVEYCTFHNGYTMERHVRGFMMGQE